MVTIIEDLQQRFWNLLFFLVSVIELPYPKALHRFIHVFIRYILFFLGAKQWFFLLEIERNIVVLSNNVLKA